MISRRGAIATALSISLGLHHSRADEYAGDFLGVPDADLVYPSAVDQMQYYGSKDPTTEMQILANGILDNAPSGPRPIDVAEYFLSKSVDSHYVEQWPSHDSWNPVIVRFFEATGLKVSNDMVPWCAAFINWCLVRSGRNGSNSASSQSFLNEKFKKTDDPTEGDLIVLAFFEAATSKPTGLGHVAFLLGPPQQGIVEVLGGNQSKSGKSSVICRTKFPLKTNVFSRCIGRADGVCTRLISGYLAKADFVKVY